jgi:hypothetical protein
MQELFCGNSWLLQAYSILYFQLTILDTCSFNDEQSKSIDLLLYLTSLSFHYRFDLCLRVRCNCPCQYNISSLPNTLAQKNLCNVVDTWWFDVYTQNELLYT